MQAGKTTLLNLLSARPSLGKHGKSSGNIFIDGAPVGQEWQRGLGYVMQRDIFFEESLIPTQSKTTYVTNHHDHAAYWR